MASDSRTLVVDDPFTGEPACSVTLADEGTIGGALERARDAARAWRKTPLAERVAVCERATAAMEAQGPAIAADITRMMGKPIAQALGEVKTCVARARHLIGAAPAALEDLVLPPLPGFERRIVREPLGVVFDLPAWNYPLLTAVNCVVPAVLAGNAVVIKHSPRTPLCAGHFARAFADAGAPSLVEALFCDYEASERIVGDERVDHVVFTGSILGGRRIVQAASRRFLHPCLELGGNDPAYVAPDCDLEKTVENVVDGAIYNAGQSCCAVERVYVHEAIYARFLEMAETLVRAYVMGDPKSEKTTLGPIAQPHHLPELESLVADARECGARVIAGGKRASVDGRGRFFEATLIAECRPLMKLFRQESFGPIVPVMRVESDDEAIVRMNDSRLGLTASVWTADRDRADRFARSLECGTVFMNRCDYLDPALPWSGWKDSGRGVSLSSLGFDALTRPKAVHFRTAW